MTTDAEPRGLVYGADDYRASDDALAVWAKIHRLDLSRHVAELGTVGGVATPGTVRSHEASRDCGSTC